MKTFDEHEDKVWALAVSKTDDKFITGGADSTLIEWKVRQTSRYSQTSLKGHLSETQGLFVQSIVSLMSSLRGHLIFAMRKLIKFFFDKNKESF